MEFLILTVLYFFIGVIIMGIHTYIEYSNMIKENIDPVPTYSVLGRSRSSNEEIEKLEEKRRKKLAQKAKNSGVITGLIWPVFLLTTSIYLIYSLFSHLLDKLAIAPVDEPYVTKKSYERAQKIIKEYERQTRESFDKELELK